MCRDHRHLPACQKQRRQNDPACQVHVPTRVEVHVMGDPGQIDISTRVEVRVMGDPSHV